ncbi:hypothetical protein QNE97_002332 [Vibrio alginolyticus]|nr:hypothetical protein [Vibrio alginolyticus]
MDINYVSKRDLLIDNIEKGLFFILSLSCALIGFPSEMSIVALGSYVVFLGLFSLFVFFNNGFKCKKYEAHYICIVVLFFLYSIFNSVVSYKNGYEIYDWLVSMVSVFSLFITITLIFSKLRADFIIKVVITVSFLWTLKVMAEVLQLIPFTSLLGIRITGVVIDSVMPYPLVAAVLTLFYLCDRYKFGYLLYAWFCFFIVIVGYKAVILLVGIATLVYFFCHRVDFYKILVLLILLSVFVWFGLYEYVILRFDSIGGGGDVIRINEVQEAMKLFEKSPLYGVGFGFSIPNSETAGLTKTYMHNSFVYLITSIGLTGLILYCLVLFGTCINNGRLNYLSLLLFLLVASSLTAASFKLFQFNYLLAVVLYINLKRSDLHEK